MSAVSLVGPLGARLRSLYDLIEAAQLQPLNRYDRIWDCCCDHGYLGIKIVEAELCEKLVFVDQVPHIIQWLDSKLEALPKERFSLIAGDASDLVFDAKQRHLVILAGVSGSTVTAIMGAILKAYAGDSIDFLLCPTHGVFEVREYLIDARVSLMDEWIVSEKGRHYEVIHIRAGAEIDGDVKVSSVGKMWNANDKDHEAYLKKNIAHYQRAEQGDDAVRSKRILEEYRGIR
ncbi:hypothetical protein A9Q81_20030 [Gammaproteobacteria bacterium 42_54_T18]|nr:hypothetical protein A9Q81_20030 [Gammaproteobacteria bacterium 42_54_T18]